MLRLVRHFRLKNFDYHLASEQILKLPNRTKTCTLLISSSLKNIPILTEKQQYFCQKPSSSIVFIEVDPITFEKVCEETLESLTDFFEELVENNDKLRTGDVSFSSGVLTVHLGKHGTYVINRQSPNKQIWLSSPQSGPKRYDYVPDGSYWIYKHNFETLHELLQNEISSIVGQKINMSKCAHYKIN